jgi:hypothetical protein
VLELAPGDNSGYPTRPGAAGVVVVDGRADSVQGAMHGARVVEGVAGGTVPVGSRSAEAEAWRIHVEQIEYGLGNTHLEHLVLVLVLVLAAVQEQQDLYSYVHWRC